MAALLSTACGASSPTNGANPTGDTLPDMVATGSVAVLADPVLSGAFNASKARMAIDNGGLQMAMSFGAVDASGARKTDVVAGPSAAVDSLVKAGIVDVAHPFARDVLEAAISPGNPQQLTSATDLARPGLRVLVASDQARSALAKLGVQASAASSVAAGVSAVNAGQADAIVAYASELAASAADLRLSLPEKDNAPRVYAAAVVFTTKARSAAEAFVEQLTSGVGSQALQGSGFHLP